MPAGRLADRFGVRLMRLAGLATLMLGCLLLSLVPPALGIAGYAAAIVVTTLGYAMFQTANNTSVMAELPAHQRGAIAGLLNLSRNLGFLTGASLLGAVFASALPTNGIGATTPETAAHGLHVTFAIAFAMAGLALLIALKYRDPEPSPERQ
jgi:MFS family permease